MIADKSSRELALAGMVARFNALPEPSAAGTYGILASLDIIDATSCHLDGNAVHAQLHMARAHVNLQIAERAGRYLSASRSSK